MTGSRERSSVDVAGNKQKPQRGYVAESSGRRVNKHHYWGISHPIALKQGRSVTWCDHRVARKHDRGSMVETSAAPVSASWWPRRGASTARLVHAARHAAPNREVLGNGSPQVRPGARGRGPPSCRWSRERPRLQFSVGALLITSDRLTPGRSCSPATRSLHGVEDHGEPSQRLDALRRPWARRGRSATSSGSCRARAPGPGARRSPAGRGRLQARHAFVTGTPFDLGWIGGYLLIALAALTFSARAPGTGALRAAADSKLGDVLVNLVAGLAVLAGAVVGIHHFKSINDRVGHAAGDEALPASGRPPAEVVPWRGRHRQDRWRGVRGRHAGREPQGGRHVAGRRVAGPRRRARLARRRVGDHWRERGVAEDRRDGMGFEQLYRAADGALRFAKRSGAGGSSRQELNRDPARTWTSSPSRWSRTSP